MVINSICTTQFDGRPSCNCPDGYSLVDPTDAYNGCKKKFLVGCDSVRESQHDEYFMQEIPNADWSMNDYEMLGLFSMESCRSACMHDYLCAGAISGATVVERRNYHFQWEREAILGELIFHLQRI